MANAINLIDGLDGLAAGIVAIAAAAFFLYATGCSRPAMLDGSTSAPLVAIIAVGVCLGFLPHNFNPARIFMGDAGALFLGLLMAATTITVGGRTDDAVQRADVLLLRAAVHPARDPRRPDHRHAVRRSSGASPAQPAVPAPTRTTCTTG